MESCSVLLDIVWFHCDTAVNRANETKKIVVNKVVHLEKLAWIEGCKRGVAWEGGGGEGESRALKATTCVFVVLAIIIIKLI